MRKQQRADSRARRGVPAAILVAVLAVSAALAVDAGAAVKPPKGAAKPPTGSGIGTTAALQNPRCNHGEPEFGVYGRFDSTSVGGGPVCVKPWDDGDDNGGATYGGVTADTIKVVFVIPNETQRGSLSVTAGTAPVKRVDSSAGSFEDAIHDSLLPLMNFYETWGRDIEVKFVTSSGNDETAQRADVVVIKAEEPFAVLNLVVTGLDVLDAELAKEQILVYGGATTTEKALEQAPYRWGLTDAQASAVNAAEVIGKQLVGQRAEFAGSDDITTKKRKFAAVYIPSLIDVDQFGSQLERFGGTLASHHPYESSGTTFGDDALAQQQAPLIVTRMKDAGATTVVLFSDIAMNRAMMDQATKQDWYPEWFITGAIFHDLALFVRTYDQAQAAHMFGISNLSPYVDPEPTPAPPAKSIDVLTNVQNWYWGEGVGTEVRSSIPHRLNWLLNGIHTAGPKLTPKTFQQGLFAIPANGGAASGHPTGFMIGWGRTSGLPYDEYMQLGLDFSPAWWDAETDGAGNGTGSVGKGVMWYLDGAKRYKAGDWPKRPLTWFDDDGAVVKFDTRPTPAPEYAGDCTGCPSQGEAGQAGAPNADGFTAPAYGARATASS